MLHSETQIQPLHDWSLSYLANADFKVAEIGAGISLYRWFSVTEELTVPKYDGRANAYYTEDGTTDYYSFKGIKLMGRAAFDPKQFMPAGVRETFGASDLRLFMETALLGLENRFAYLPQINGTDTLWIPDSVNNFYGSRLNRIPVMVGFSFPACHLLDYLTFQVESYEWRYSNSFYDQQFYSENAKPVPTKKSYTREDYKYDQWKWSYL